MDYRILRLAIDNLSPNAEYSIDEGDLEKITWITGENFPTKAQIEAEMKKVEKAEEKKFAEKVARREALLERLGLTEDEAQLLLSQ